jgi:hypothetical protein
MSLDKQQRDADVLAAFNKASSKFGRRPSVDELVHVSGYNRPSVIAALLALDRRGALDRAPAATPASQPAAFLCLSCRFYVTGVEPLRGPCRCTMGGA